VNILKAFYSAGTANIISRITGFVRDLSTAYVLGVGVISDIYLAVFRFIFSIKRIISEENFNYAFTPIYLEEKNRSQESAKSFSFTLLILMILISTIALSFSIFFAESLVLYFFGNNITEPSSLLLLESLFKICIFYIFCIVISSILIGILNAEKKFFYSLLGPTYINLTISLVAIVCYQKMGLEDLTYMLSYAMLIGGLIQVLFLWSQVRTAVKQKFLVVKINKQALNNFIKLALPFFASATFQQLSIMISIALLSAQSGAISYIYYAERVFFIPISIFGLALTSILIPYFSSDIIHNDSRNTLKTFSSLSRYVFIISAPISIWLYFNAHELTSILFGRGEFSVSAVLYTGNVLQVLSAGMPFIFLSKIITPLYSSSKFAIPFFSITAASVFLNIILNVLLFPSFGYLIIPLTYVVTNILLSSSLLLFMFAFDVMAHIKILALFALKLLIYFALFTIPFILLSAHYDLSSLLMLIFSTISSLIFGLLLFKIIFNDDFKILIKVISH
jgi:putative peptidoglycan lipid II flippase